MSVTGDTLDISGFKIDNSISFDFQKNEAF